MTDGPSVVETLRLIDRRRRSCRWWAQMLVVTLLILAFYATSWKLAQIDLTRLVFGLPRLAHWLREAWPPQLNDLPLILRQTAETISMAALGTTLASILAIPTAVLASRNITPIPLLYRPVRLFLNVLRGIDSFVFALLFVAAVGLGPFAGMLGIGIHTWGSAAKLMADQIGTLPVAPFRLSRPLALIESLLSSTHCSLKLGQSCCRSRCFGGNSTFVPRRSSVSWVPAASARSSRIAWTLWIFLAS